MELVLANVTSRNPSSARVIFQAKDPTNCAVELVPELTRPVSPNHLLPVVVPDVRKDSIGSANSIEAAICEDWTEPSEKWRVSGPDSDTQSTNIPATSRAAPSSLRAFAIELAIQRPANRSEFQKRAIPSFVRASAAIWWQSGVGVGCVIGRTAVGGGMPCDNRLWGSGIQVKCSGITQQKPLGPSGSRPLGSLLFAGSDRT